VRVVAAAGHAVRDAAVHLHPSAQKNALAKTRIAVAGAVVVRGEAQALVGARGGLQNLRITEVIAEAARGGSIVDTAAADSMA